MPQFNDFFCEPFKSVAKILKDPVEYREAIAGKLAAEAKLGGKVGHLSL